MSAPFLKARAKTGQEPDPEPLVPPTPRAQRRPARDRARELKRWRGKTTTAINLGTALAAIGEQVLIIDLDPQGNASTGLGIERSDRKFSTYDIMVGTQPIRA